jgi:acyl-CoA reductase-like NAD-dependent aldehyde dehydrogenase
MRVCEDRQIYPLPDTMTTSLETYLTDLRTALAEVERDQEDTTLPHSDQQILDQAWEYYTAELEAVEEMLAVEQANTLTDTRGCDCCAGCLYCEEARYDPSDEI